MKVVVVGGYGVFGGRLARLLVKDGHAVWIAGRSEARAKRFAASIGAQALPFDRQGDLATLTQLRPDALVDAAGPFQTYGQQGFRLAATCLANGIHYLDLSDDADFAVGIGRLDAEARAAGRFALSGASSVPGLSSIVAAHLLEGLTQIDLIESAILPGNRAPRGRSLVANILSQAGSPLRVWRGGQWNSVFGWSERSDYDLAPGLRRSGWLIGVPDLALFPERFGARSVLFRAGTELGIFNRVLALLAWARRMGRFRPTGFLSAAAHRASELVEGLGSDTGGMVVTVVGSDGQRSKRRTWRLVARRGDGPFVPGVVVRALLREAEAVPPGARPCLAECSLPRIVDAMSDLAIETSTVESEAKPLFESVLGEAWAQLPRPVRRLHTVWDVERFSGEAQVERGQGMLARILQAAFRFPRAGDSVPVSVTLRCSQKGETWVRDFGGRTFRSHLSAAGRPGGIFERFGPFRFELALDATRSELRFPVVRGWFLGLPMPKWCLPASDTREYATEDIFHFDVALTAPLGGGLIVRYRGVLKPYSEDAPETDAGPLQSSPIEFA